MIAILRRSGTLSVLLLVFTVFIAAAQPVLPDITGYAEKNIVLLSWNCQYDGVKSIAVLRSYDSNYNYSTIGYVKKLYKGTQAFADGHPNAGRNFYKLSIVFNSGLTWSSNHTGIDVDPENLKNVRNLPSNEALQKMIVTEPAEKTPKTTTPVPAQDQSKYDEVLHKDTGAVSPPQKLKLTFTDPEDANAYVDILPESAKKKMTISYNDDAADVDASKYIEDQKKTGTEKKKVTLTFKDDAEMEAYINKMSEANRKKIKISSSTETIPVNADTYIENRKEKEVARQSAEVAPSPPKPRITIAFNDEPLDNVSNTVKSRYIAVDPATGNINMTLPDDVATHHYTLKFFDKENHMVIEIPRVNISKAIIDKRNFQKKGVYKFAIKKDILELEHGYITIY